MQGVWGVMIGGVSSCEVVPGAGLTESSICTTFWCPSKEATKSAVTPWYTSATRRVSCFMAWHCLGKTTTPHMNPEKCKKVSTWLSRNQETPKDQSLSTQLLASQTARVWRNVDSSLNEPRKAKGAERPPSSAPVGVTKSFHVDVISRTTPSTLERKRAQTQQIRETKWTETEPGFRIWGTEVWG